jgi:hypothetical protein
VHFFLVKGSTVTSLKDIQSLIADIDSILAKADARLPWYKPSDAALQRQVLERVRRYLVSQQQKLAGASKEPLVSTTPVPQDMVQQIVQAVNREMNVMRTDLMQPLKADVEALRRQREALAQEIRQLEQRRQQMDSFNQRSTAHEQILSEFSQGLINCCTETLTQQLAQILANFEADVGSGDASGRSHNTPPSYSPIALAPSYPASIGGATPQPSSEQIRKLQEQSDRMILALEANQRAIFEALNRDLQSYQDSLAQGLEKMHSLGAQGEMLFTALINRLAQQLGRDASTLFSPSLPQPEPTSQPQTTNTQPTSSTLLPPSNLLQGTESIKPSPPTAPSSFTPRLVQPISSPQLQTPLHPPQTAQPPLTEAETPKEDSIHSIPTQEEQAAIPQTPQAETGALPSLLDSSESSTEDSFLESLNSEDWEIIEGLESENLDLALSDNDEVDTFIQLDIDNLVPPPTLEVLTTLTPSDTQEADFLLGGVNAHYSNASNSGETTGTDERSDLGNWEIEPELNLSQQHRRQDIDELYKSLFGVDSLVDTPDVESSVSTPRQDSENVQVLGDELRDRFDDATPLDTESSPAHSTDSTTPLSPEVENVLFEGLADPASESNLEQSLAEDEEMPESWQALLFEEPAPPAPSPSAPVAPSSIPGDSSPSIGVQDGIETITALTDLLEQMGLSPSSPTTEDTSIPASTPPQAQHQTSETTSEVNVAEDSYVPASPDEDLLETTMLESDSDVQISLDPNTLDQLQQDLSRFEQSVGENTQRQEEQGLLGHEVKTSEGDHSQHQDSQFLMPPQESLAEDWEEFILHQLATEQGTPPPIMPTAPEAVASDFDPDLFPGEALELDHESAENTNTAASGELFAFEAESDENFVEMLWDEPTDSTTEEAIASPEFDTSYFPPTELGSEQHDPAIAPISDPPREDVQDEASTRSPDPIPPQDAATGEPKELPETGLNPEPKSEPTASESVKPSPEGAGEDEALKPPTPEIQTSDQSNFDVHSPQPEDLKSEQPNNPQKGDRDSD